MIEPEVVLEKLGALGSSRAIAKFLEEEGVSGKLKGATSCPIANYVRRETGVSIAVSAELWAGHPDAERRPVPRWVGEFVARFDDGAFPALVGRYFW